MNDGKGTVSVGSGTLPTGACVYCGKICETKNGACAECMGSPTVISGKFPTALAERFITYREEKSYPTSNALLMEILNSFFGYGRSQRPLPKDKDESYQRLIDDLSIFPEYSDVVLRVREDYEMFRLPDAVRNLLPSLKDYPKEFSEILSLEMRRPSELKVLTEMPQDVLETLNIFSSYPKTVRSSLQVITAYPELAERLLGYLDKGSLTGEVPEAEPESSEPEPQVIEEPKEPPTPVEELGFEPPSDLSETELKILLRVNSKGKVLPSDLVREERFRNASAAASVLVDLENRGPLVSEVSETDFRQTSFSVRRDA